MGRSIKSIVETKKNRLKRRSGKIFQEIVRATILVSAAGVLALIMVYSYSFIITTSWFQLKNITVRGIERTSEKEILNLAGIKSHSNILTLNLKEISRKIEAAPWVKDVSIGRELPDRLVIEVCEREPAALILVDKSLYIMDWNEELFKKLTNSDDVHLPVLNGVYKNGDMDKNLIEGAMALLKLLSSKRNFTGIQHISEIYGDDVYGFSIFTKSGLCLQLGFGNYDRKLQRIKPVLVDLARRNLDKVHLVLDLSDFTKVVVKGKTVVNPKSLAGAFNA
jgi:cell division protein FtsQ